MVLMRRPDLQILFKAIGSMLTVLWSYFGYNIVPWNSLVQTTLYSFKRNQPGFCIIKLSGPQELIWLTVIKARFSQTHWSYIPCEQSFQMCHRCALFLKSHVVCLIGLKGLQKTWKILQCGPLCPQKSIKTNELKKSTNSKKP